MHQKNIQRMRSSMLFPDYLSIHGIKDICCLLCNDRKTQVQGEKLIEEALLIADNFDAITWDIRFSNMYNENSSYLRQIEKVRNIHIHAELLGGEWFLDNSGVDDVLGETVSDIIEKLPASCNSIITLESVSKDSEWNDFKRSMGVLRKAMTNKGPKS